MKFKKLISEIVNDKVIVVRVDFNVPLNNGEIVENTRIVESIPTIKYLIDNNAKRIHILTHLGRPNGTIVPTLSTKLLIKELEKLLGESVEFREDFTNGKNKIQLHENTRFWKGEKENDPELVEEIYNNLQPDLFINEGFSVSHRTHASVVGLAKYVPCYPGFLLEKEIESLSPFQTNEKIPGLVAVLSGIKMKTKIPVLEHFAKISDHILLGGGIANTFLVAQGYDVGKSLYEEDSVKNARRILKIANQYNTGMHIPVDTICADAPDSMKAVDADIDTVLVHMSIFDIGPKTLQSYCEILQHAKTIIWNGPVGMMEKELFAGGTHGILKCIQNQKNAKTIIGGGDTLQALKKWDIPKTEFSHVSTGGGSMLEFLEGKVLPGIEILKK